MAMVVKNNMSAVSTLNTLNKNSSALQKSLQKVSSGMKINSAQDDASGYAISEKMRVQIRSLDQANQNTQNASSLMKTAEGAVSSTVEILKSLKEKAINAATDTNTDSDRVTIQKELDQFIDQIDDNALTTFNGKYLVDGSKSQYGSDTYTTMTNQSLDADTNGATKLTALKNRNHESLEIESTDYVTASFVKNGKTYTTKFNVGEADADLNKIYSKMTDEYERLESTTSNPTPAAFGTEKLKWDDASDTIIQNAVDYLVSDSVSVAELESVVGGTASTNTKLNQAFELAKQDTTKLDAAITAATNKIAASVNTAVASYTGPLTTTTTTTGWTGTEYSGTPQPTVNYSVTPSATAGTAWTYDTPSNTLKFSAAKSDVGVTYGSGATDSNKKLSDADVGVAVATAVKGNADTAAAAGTYVAGSVTTALNAAKTIGATTTVSVTGTAPNAGTGAASVAGPGAAVTVTGSISTAAANDSDISTAAKGILAKQAVTDLTSDPSTLSAAKTGTFAKSSNYVVSSSVVGKNASNDNVTTADGTVGLTISAADSGIQNQISGVTISVTDSDGNVKKSANAALDNFRTTIYAKNASDRNELTFQVGASANQSITVGLDDMRAEALGLKSSDGTKVSVATQDNANAAVAVFDNAIQKALDQQTTIGAVEARLEYTSNNLTTSSENVQAAESTIRDSDMAKEMTNYTKNNVLLQAAQSMLAQANQSSSQVLSLLQ